MGRMEKREKEENHVRQREDSIRRSKGRMDEVPSKTWKTIFQGLELRRKVAEDRAEKIDGQDQMTRDLV